ncbi:MAG TPA: hypothetical protein VF701_05930 [Thermoanaerobaculia bacterium]
MNRIVTLGVFVLLIAGCRTPPPEGAVARIGDQLITLDEIRCGVPEGPECLKRQQQNFKTIALEHLLHHAAAIHGVAVKDEDVRAALPDQELFEEMAEWTRTAGRAVLAVHDGADADQVFAEFAPAGVNRQAFDEMLRRWNRTEAEFQATANHAVTQEKQMFRQARFRREYSALGWLAYDMTLRERISVADAEEKIWKKMLRDTKVEIYDDRFTLPELSGLLD